MTDIDVRRKILVLIKENPEADVITLVRQDSIRPENAFSAEGVRKVELHEMLTVVPKFLREDEIYFKGPSLEAAIYMHFDNAQEVINAGSEEEGEAIHKRLQEELYRSFQFEKVIVLYVGE